MTILQKIGIPAREILDRRNQAGCFGDSINNMFVLSNKMFVFCEESVCYFCILGEEKVFADVGWKIFCVVGVVWCAVSAADVARVSYVLSVYDGDTFFANIDDWPAAIGRDIGIRIGGIDAPEVRGACPAERALAVAARDAAAELLQGAETVRLKNVRRDCCSFRIVAEVFADGVDVGGFLLARGLARVYDGRRRGWCPNAE